MLSRAAHASAWVLRINGMKKPLVLCRHLLDGAQEQRLILLTNPEKACYASSHKANQVGRPNARLAFSESRGVGRKLDHHGSNHLRSYSFSSVHYFPHSI